MTRMWQKTLPLSTSRNQLRNVCPLHSSHAVVSFRDEYLALYKKGMAELMRFLGITIAMNISIGSVSANGMGLEPSEMLLGGHELFVVQQIKAELRPIFSNKAFSETTFCRFPHPRFWSCNVEEKVSDITGVNF